MDLLKQNVVFYVTTLVKRNDVFVSVVLHDEDFVEQKLDVCLVLHGDGGSEIESDVEGVVAVEVHPVKEDGLE